MASHLSGGKINLSVLRESYRRDLLECLDRCVGTKALVWDSVLTGPFGLVAEYPLLQEHEVEKMFLLESGRLSQANVQNIVFIVRPKLELMDIIAENILKEESSSNYSSSNRKEYHILFVPRRSLICEKKLKDLNVYGYLNVKEDFCLDLIPFDYDLLSMESEISFRECYLYKDYTSLFHMAKSIMTIQALYGVIPNIYGKGDCARHVTDMILRMRREMAGSEMQITPQIDNLVLIDRMVDPLTPLLSQLTYEGLIDEIYNIHNCTAKFPPEKFTKAEDGSKKEDSKKIILNSAEELYAEIRDKNFNAVGPALSKKAKLISALADERHTAKTVGELRDFVTKLPHMTAAKHSLATHTSIAELIKEVTDSDEFLECLRTQQDFINGLETDKPNPYIEDCIAKKEPVMKVIRMICIQSICNTGLKIKVLEYYKREILQTYGFKHMITLQNLEKCGLIQIQQKPIFSSIRKTLKLVVEEVQEQNPNDISYVFSGYAPISVRLAQYLARPGWRSITELLNLLPGPRIEEVQQIPVGLRKRRGSISSTHSSSTEQKTTLIIFLGGITYAEIAALRFLAQCDDSPTDYIIGTTKLINGESWLNSIADELEIPPPNPF